MPCRCAAPPASRRWAGIVAAAHVAALALCVKEVDLPNVNLCLHRRALFCILRLDDEDGVALALAVPPSAHVHIDVVNWVGSLAWSLWQRPYILT